MLTHFLSLISLDFSLESSGPYYRRCLIFKVRCSPRFRRAPDYNTTTVFICQHFFSNFFKKFFRQKILVFSGKVQTQDMVVFGIILYKKAFKKFLKNSRKSPFYHKIQPITKEVARKNAAIFLVFFPPIRQNSSRTNYYIYICRCLFRQA